MVIYALEQHFRRSRGGARTGERLRTTGLDKTDLSMSLLTTSGGFIGAYHRTYFLISRRRYEERGPGSRTSEDYGGFPAFDLARAVHRSAFVLTWKLRISHVPETRPL